jgi:3-dehydroquinate dehydratase II
MTASATSVYPRTSTKRHRIAFIEGPNTSNMGKRTKSVYGDIGSLDELKAFCVEVGNRFGVEIVPFSSNIEGEILEFIHENTPTIDAWIVNPAGLTVYGIPTVHALVETYKPFVEVHFANVTAAPTHPRGIPVGPWDSTFTRFATGISMGLREHTYVGTILALTLSLDDEQFLGQPTAE